MRLYAGDITRVNRTEWCVTFDNGSTNATLNISILDTANCTNADEFQLYIDSNNFANYSNILNCTTDITKHNASVIIMDDDCRSKYHNNVCHINF